MPSEIALHGRLPFVVNIVDFEYSSRGILIDILVALAYAVPSRIANGLKGVTRMTFRAYPL